METSTVADLPISDTTPADTTDLHGRRLSRVMVAILVAYVAFILVLMVVRGAYMSPDLFVFLDHLPRTSSDKVDLRALKSRVSHASVG